MREELLKSQKQISENIVQAQKIALEHLEESIRKGDSATVAAMAEIFKV